MRTELFDYELPAELIAQQPAEPRDASRLLVLHRADGRVEHRRFVDIIDYIDATDLLVANDSRVIRARLTARKTTGGKVEIFLLRPEPGPGETWECLVRGRGLRAGSRARLLPRGDQQGEDEEVWAEICEVRSDGGRTISFSRPLRPILEEYGEIPLPPYIDRYRGESERYQTIYSRPEGSVAAPTAGLHFTPDLLQSLHQKGILWDTVTLHVGLDTFRPVSVDEIDEHPMHSEWARLGVEAAERINRLSLSGGRVVGVGTTSVRTLEWAATSAQGIDPYDPQACPWKRVAAFDGSVDLFIRPGYRFRAVDGIITNFHLPRSSLLMMISAFVGQPFPNDPDAGRRMLLDVYGQAIDLGYRFYSFGDAMLII